MLQLAMSFIYKEISMALERQTHFDQRVRFLIPAILEPCAGLELLSRLQHADLTSSEGVERLAKVIQDDWNMRRSRFRRPSLTMNVGTKPVGWKKPNSLGLYDMSGNVWGWVEDCWFGDYQGAPRDGSAWREAGGGELRPARDRGGSWYHDTGNLCASNRIWNPAAARGSNIGFRLAQDLP